MKKLLIFLLTLSLLLVSCNKGGDTETTAPESTDKVTSETPKQETPNSIIEFTSTNEKWALTYDTKSDDKALILSDGTAEYHYSPNTDDLFSVDFDITSSDDAQLIISDDEKYAVIIYNSILNDIFINEYGYIPSDEAVIITLDNGQILEKVIMPESYFSKNDSYDKLEEYDNKSSPLYEIRMSAKFVRNTIEFHGKLTTFDGKITMDATSIHEYTDTSAINTPDGYKATMILPPCAEKYDNDLGRYNSLNKLPNNELYYVYFAIPSKWKPSYTEISVYIREYHKYNNTPDYVGYSRDFYFHGLCEINEDFGFDENIHGYFYEGQPVPDHDPQEVWYPPTSPLENYVKEGAVHSGVTAKGYEYVAYGEESEPDYVYIKISDKYFIYFDFKPENTEEYKEVIKTILDTFCVTTDPNWTESQK